MRALAAVSVIYLILFIFYRRQGLKNFLILTGIVSLPFPLDGALMYSPGIGGWSNGITISISNLSFIVLFIQLIIRYLSGSRSSLYRLSPDIVNTSLFFISACSLSIVNSTAGMRTFFQVVMIFKLFFLYYCVLVKSITSEEDLISAINFLTLSLCLQSVYACVQVLCGFNTDILRTGAAITHFQELDSGVSRAVGTIGKPNALAMYIVPLLLLNLSVFFMALKSKTRMLVIGVSLLGLLFTFSRGGWISFFLALALLFLLGAREGFIKPKHVVTVVLTLGIISWLALPWVMDRVYGDDHNSANSRWPLITMALDMFRENMLFGIGANTFMNVKYNYMTLDMEGLYLYTVHNMYLLIMAETGIIGLVAFLWMQKSFWKEAWKVAVDGTTPFTRSVGMGVLMALFSAAIHMMVDMYSGEKSIGNMFILVGLCTAARQVQAARRDYLRSGRFWILKTVFFYQRLGCNTPDRRCGLIPKG